MIVSGLSRALARGLRTRGARVARAPVAPPPSALESVASALPAAAAAALPPAPAPLPPLRERPDVVVSSRFRGVFREGRGATLWEAVLEVPSEPGEGGAPAQPAREVSGGEYEDEAEAARAFDALARMYLGRARAAELANFEMDDGAAWVPPETVAQSGQIETRVGEPLTADEVAAALRQERGVDVRVVPLAGRSDLADALVFVTGNSVPHMRRMADMVARAQRKRRLRGSQL